MSENQTRVIFDPSTLRDLLVVDNIYAKTTWPGEKYVGGCAESIQIDVSEDSDIDEIIEVLSAEKAKRARSRLSAEVKRLEREYQQALASKDSRWAAWEQAESEAFSKYAELHDAQARLVDGD